MGRVTLNLANGSTEHFNVDDAVVAQELLNFTNRTGRFITPWVQVASADHTVKYVQYDQIVSVSAKVD
jgi:hypothetical protein